MEHKPSKCVTGFRKSNGAQHLLVTMLGKWKKLINKGDCVSALF